ncbi:MAG: DUF2330 domain-containing protein [Pseudomonadota bacterium]
MKKYFVAIIIAVLFGTAPYQSDAFCGFYAAKADAKLFNKSSKVVISHDGDKNVITMSSDYEGSPKEFAMVVPVPTVITKEQVHITENALIDHVDAYTAPRLVEYFDQDPCLPVRKSISEGLTFNSLAKSVAEDAPKSAAALGVKIEDQYNIGEYDILILSAKESNGLETWLNQNGYKIPEGASAVLGSYIKQDMKFFVAKVNLKAQEKLGFSYLRPIQVAYESSKFMLPIRLGTVNAKGPQELFIFTLTKKGRVETTNYRTVKIPTNNDVPLFTKKEFGDFYKAMFDNAVKKEGMRTVFLEYAWNMGACDPCSADPIPNDKLLELGAFWLVPKNPPPYVRFSTPQYSGDTFITRLHVRYDRQHFPEDLMLQETPNSESFQGRYVLHHPWKGEASCPAATQYRKNLPERFSKEAENLANLTGWEISDIRKKMESNEQSFDPNQIAKPIKWYEQLWKK